MTGRVDEVDEEGRLVDLHVVGPHDTFLALGGGCGGVGGDLGLLRRLAGALRGLRLQLSARHLLKKTPTTSDDKGEFRLLQKSC